MKTKILATVLAAGFAHGASAAEALAAVAANFTDVATELAQKFQTRTGHTLKTSFGASGKFVAQIENGAPFHLFLSADAERPAVLEAKGLGVEGTRFVYATGKLALWSPVAGYVDAQGEVLHKKGFTRIAVANPRAAPYGQAAIDVMRKRGVWDALSPKLVQGENIAQTFQFVHTGNAQLGFIALSQVMALDTAARGSYWIVPAELHAPIEQQAILLQKGANNPAAKAFLDFLQSDEAKAVIARYGYGV